MIDVSFLPAQIAGGAIAVLSAGFSALLTRRIMRQGRETRQHAADAAGSAVQGSEAAYTAVKARDDVEARLESAEAMVSAIRDMVSEALEKRLRTDIRFRRIEDGMLVFGVRIRGLEDDVEELGGEAVEGDRGDRGSGRDGGDRGGAAGQ